MTYIKCSFGGWVTSGGAICLIQAYKWKENLLLIKQQHLHKMFHKCFLGMVGKIHPEPKSRWSFQIKPQVLKASRASQNLLCCLFLMWEKSAYVRNKAVRCEVCASWGVQLPGWSFSLSAQSSTLKSLVKLNVQQSPKQWSAKVQFELAAVHAAVMKQEGKKKDGIKGRVNSALDIFSTEKILQREQGRKMNILIFITHKCSTISEARIWK